MKNYINEILLLKELDQFPKEMHLSFKIMSVLSWISWVCIFGIIIYHIVK